MSGRMNGLECIAEAFASAKVEGRAALMPYFTLGYPDPETSLDIVEAIAQAGADLIELGFPFSDPLADGPTIQHSTQVALEQGMNATRCIEMVASLRTRGVTQPIMLMGYVNPILAFGVERFVAQAAQAGADGFIVPDLPPEEGAKIEAACRAHGRALVYLLAPTSPPERVELLAGRTSGFLYLVSLAGVTGAREALPLHLADFCQRARAVAHTPLAVGFGISTPDQACAVGQLADGVIVGSALIKAAGQSADPVRAAANFVRDLRAGLEQRVD
jgi:tryptophan synthase alpha chain